MRFVFSWVVAIATATAGGWGTTPTAAGFSPLTGTFRFRMARITTPGSTTTTTTRRRPDAPKESSTSPWTNSPSRARFGWQASLSSSSLSSSSTTNADLHPTVPLVAFFPTRDASHQKTFVMAYENSVLPLLRQEPGFVACHIHVSCDGTRVALYEQWESYDACIQCYLPDSLSTAVRTSLKYVLEVQESAVDRHLYQVVASSSEEAEAPSTPPLVLNPKQCPLVHFGILRVPPPASPDLVSQMVELMRKRQAAAENAAEGGALLTSTIHQSVDSAQVVNYGQWAVAAAAAAAAAATTTSTATTTAATTTPLLSSSWFESSSPPQLLDPAAFAAEQAYWQDFIANNNNNDDDLLHNLESDYRMFYLISSHGKQEKDNTTYL